MLEETKMIMDVGAWVLRESCRQVKEWVDKGYKAVPVSVNLSLVQFKQKDLGEMITETLKGERHRARIDHLGDNRERLDAGHGVYKECS